MPEHVDILKVAAEYWYVAVPVALAALLFIVALVAMIVKVCRNIRENSNVSRARREDSNKKQYLAEQNRKKMEEHSAKKQEQVPFLEGTEGEDVGIILSGSYKMPSASKETLTNKETFTNNEEDSNMAKTEVKAAKAEPAKATQKAEPAKAAKATENAKSAVNTENVNDEKAVTEPAGKEERVIKAVYRVSYDKESKEWLIKKDGAQRVIRRCRTKAEALELANQFAENQDLSLSVQKKDGKFQKKTIYTKMLPADKGDKKD